MKPIIKTIFFVLISVQFVFADLNDGLIAYLPFNGNANDTIGENNGIVHGASLTNDRFGNINSAYSFDGTDDYIKINDSVNIRMDENFSLSLWVFVNTSELRYILGKNSTETVANYDIMISKDKIHFDFEDSSDNDYQTNYQLTMSKWNHIVFTKNGSSYNFYVNGQFVGTKLWSFSAATGNYNLYIGTGSGEYFGTSYYNGKLDELRIYNRTLSIHEIQELYGINCSVSDIDKDGVIDQWDVCSQTVPNSATYSNGCQAHDLYSYIDELEQQLNSNKILIEQKENEIEQKNIELNNLKAKIDIMFSEQQIEDMVAKILLWGDTDNDGKIGLQEAIKALIVTSGISD